MAYGGYYPYYAQNSSLTPNFASFTQNQPSNVQNNGIIWVCGEAGAKSYLVAPNTTVALWDSESQTIYLKSADASGMPSIKTLDYTVRDRVQGEIRHENAPKVEFVTREEFDALKRQIEGLKEATHYEHISDAHTDKE
jgi:hypothetical protein